MRALQEIDSLREQAQLRIYNFSFMGSHLVIRHAKISCNTQQKAKKVPGTIGNECRVWILQLQLEGQESES